MKYENIKCLVENNGEISIGRFGPCRFAAVAIDCDNMIAALKKKKDESLEELLNRLDKAIDLAFEEEIYTDEIN